MKPITKNIVFNNCNFQLLIFENGIAHPDYTDVQKYLGLPQMDDDMSLYCAQFFDWGKIKKAIRIKANYFGISVKEAYVKTLRSTIISLGLAMTYSKLPLDLNQGKLKIKILTHLVKMFTEPTYEVIIELFKKEGFTSHKIEDSLIKSGIIPTVKMMLSEYDFNLP